MKACGGGGGGGGRRGGGGGSLRSVNECGGGGGGGVGNALHLSVGQFCNRSCQQTDLIEINQTGESQGTDKSFGGGGGGGERTGAGGGGRGV